MVTILDLQISTLYELKRFTIPVSLLQLKDLIIIIIIIIIMIIIIKAYTALIQTVLSAVQLIHSIDGPIQVATL